MHERAAMVILLATMGLAHAEQRADVTVGAPNIIGALDAKAVAAVLEKSKSKLVACYRTALQTTRMAGVLTARLTIGADGKVTAATAEGVAAGLDACVAAALGKLRFGKPKDGKAAEVTLTIELETSSGFAAVIGTDDSEVHGNMLGDPKGESNVGFGGLGAHMPSGTGPSVRIGQPNATGDLDKAIIRRYIKRNIHKLRYCYEKQLLITPALNGTVIAEFTIGVDGAVSASTAKGLHESVDACVARVIQAIQFPRPATGSGEVKVTYPFAYLPGETKPTKGPPRKTKPAQATPRAEPAKPVAPAKPAPPPAR